MLPRRMIALYLNASDKIRTIALLSRQWNELIYSGYSWEVLFSNSYDQLWNPDRINERLFKMFKHFKGVTDLHIYEGRYNLKHLQDHISEIQHLHLSGFDDLKPSSKRFQNLLYLLSSDQIFDKVVENRWNISRLHILAAKGVVKEQGKSESLEGYLKSGANINELDGLNLTPLHYAMRFCKNPKVVEFILINGGDLKLIQRSKNTPLHTSARWSKHVQVFEFILSQWPDMKALDSDKKTPLHSAAENENPEVIRSLLKKKTDVEIQDRFGRRPLHYAAKSSNLKVFQILLNYGANLLVYDKQKLAPVHFAAMNSNPEILMHLIEKGYNVKQINGRNSTLAHFAAQNQNPWTLRFLIEHGVEFNISDKKNGRTPLHYAVISGNFEALKILVDNGAKLNVKDNQRNTAAHYAAENKNSKFLRYLAVKKVNLKLENMKLQTPLDVAALKQNAQSVRIALQSGVKRTTRHFCGREPIKESLQGKTVEQVIKFVKECFWIFLAYG